MLKIYYATSDLRLRDIVKSHEKVASPIVNQWTELPNVCSLGCLLTNFAQQQQNMSLLAK